MAILLSPTVHGATITGTVKGPDDASFQGVFVKAQNTKNITATVVLPDAQRHIRFGPKFSTILERRILAQLRANQSDQAGYTRARIPSLHLEQVARGFAR